MWKSTWRYAIKTYLQGVKRFWLIPNSGNANGVQANKWIILSVDSSKVEAWVTRPCAGQCRQK